MDTENEKSPNRSHDSSSKDGQQIVPSQPTKAKQPQLISILRAMRHSQAIATIGRDAYALVVYIAERCDEGFWRGPVAFYNVQLAEALAFGSWRSLERARAIAVESGWLIYEQRGAKLPGLYLATIPSHAMPQRHMNERTYDETAYQNAVQSAYQNAVQPAALILPITRDLEPNVDSACETASQPTKKGRKPKNLTEPNKPRDLDEIRAYIAEAKLQHITAEEFWDGQQQRGWVSGRTPVKDWKAALRVWNRNNERRAPYTQQQAQQPPQPPAAPQKRVPAENRPPRNRFGGISQ